VHCTMGKRVPGFPGERKIRRHGRKEGKKRAEEGGEKNVSFYSEAGKISSPNRKETAAWASSQEGKKEKTSFRKREENELVEPGPRKGPLSKPQQRGGGGGGMAYNPIPGERGGYSKTGKKRKGNSLPRKGVGSLPRGDSKFPGGKYSLPTSIRRGLHFIAKNCPF